MNALRPYQENIRAQIHENLKEHDSTLAVMATGCGKTRLASAVIADFQPKKVIWLVHTRELVYQAARAVREATGLGVDLEMAEMTASTNLFTANQVIVASRQTLISGNGTKRFERFDPDMFGLLVADEAHHCTSESYDDIFAHFKKNPNLKILGLTATPNRADEEALGKVFTSVSGP